MRTISLREHQPKTERNLTSDEVTALLGLNKYLTLRPVSIPAGEYELRAGSTVGTIVCEDLRILIRPKVNLQNVFFLLGYGHAAWSDLPFKYDVEPDLLEVVGWSLEAEIERAARAGVVRDYVGIEESLPTIKGRVDIGAQMRRRQNIMYPIECRHDEYTEDILLNQMIRAAVNSLLTFPMIDPELYRRLRHRFRLFVDVTEMTFAPGFLPEVQFNRLCQHWRGAYELARLSLANQTLRDLEGQITGRAFTIDMNALFERFVETVVAEEVRKVGFELTPQDRRRFTKNILMKPDLVVKAADDDVAVGDIKYKEREIQDWEHADLYQILGYCNALNLPRGLLIYAADRPHEVERVSNTEIDLEIIGIDLTGSRKEILEGARAAARLLIAEAGHQTRLWRSA